MHRSDTPARATLERWREQDAAQLDPVRFHYIDALERRAAGQQGEARRLLDERLASLVQAYAADLEKVGPSAVQVDAAQAPEAPEAIPVSAVAELLQHLASQAATHGDPVARAAFPEVSVLEDFRGLWSKIRAESQLRESLEQAPTDAGPLNSATLVHRSLLLMRELSPGYLRHFLSYVDTLSWIEQVNAGGVATKSAPRPANVRKRSRVKKPGEPAE